MDTEQAWDDQEQSKSAAKRDCHRLTDIGEELLKLRPEERRTLDLPESVEDAIEFAATIKSRGAAKRQRLTIGKLLRSMGTDRLEEGLKKIRQGHDSNTARFQRLEHYRDKLIDNDKQALSELIAQYPDIDRQHIHQLIRAAQQQRKAEQPPAAARKLFKYLRGLEEAAG
jgi:ribosome-associated protein